MRKVVLYIAMSLDGYIADAGGGVRWLSGQDGAETEGSYDAFAGTVDTVVMGWRTYRQIVTDLSPRGVGVQRNADLCRDPPGAAPDR